jgi:hypothetical protein
LRPDAPLAPRINRRAITSPAPGTDSRSCPNRNFSPRRRREDRRCGRSSRGGEKCGLVAAHSSRASMQSYCFWLASLLTAPVMGSHTK